MAFKCPHCSEPIEGAMSQESHRERLKAKDDENKSLVTELKEAQKKSKQYDSVVKERDDYKAEVDKRDAAVERSSAFNDAGIDPKYQAGFEALYASAVASAEDGKAPSFKDWLNSEEAKTHPLLSDRYGQKSESAADPKTEVKPQPKTQTKTPVTPGKTGLTNTDKGATTPPSGGAIDTPDKLRDYLNSPEYRAMSREEQKKEIAGIQAQIAAAEQDGR
jgi:hypothetical protein